MDNTKHEIPDDLKAAWDVLPQNCWERQLIERIARLGAPLSQQEKQSNFFKIVDHGDHVNVTSEVRFEAIIAARQSAKEPPSPPSTKERQE